MKSYMAELISYEYEEKTNHRRTEIGKVVRRVIHKSVTWLACSIGYIHIILHVRTCYPHTREHVSQTAKAVHVQPALTYSECEQSRARLKTKQEFRWMINFKIYIHIYICSCSLWCVCVNMYSWWGFNCLWYILFACSYLYCSQHWKWHQYFKRPVTFKVFVWYLCLF